MPAHYGHVLALVEDLRPEDAETVALLGGAAAERYGAALSRSMYASTALIEGRPVAMWGASVDSFLLPGPARIWLLIRGDVRRPAHFTARYARRFVDDMQTCYGRLVTTVTWGHAGDRAFIRWLGFRRVPAEDAGRFLAYERV